MSKKSRVFILSMLCLFLILNGKLIYANETGLFEEIISKTGSNVIEYGVSANFITGLYYHWNSNNKGNLLIFNFHIKL